MKLTIPDAAIAIVALDREAMAKGERITGGVREYLRRLPHLAYELSLEELVDAAPS